MLEAAAEETTGGRSNPSLYLLRHAVRDLPLGLGATLLGFLVLARVYAVAHFSLTTTSALLTTSPSDVLWGTLASYTYLLMAFVSVGSVFVWWHAGRLALGNAWSALLLSAGVIFGLLSPAIYLCTTALLGALFGLGLYVREWQPLIGPLPAPTPAGGPVRQRLRRRAEQLRHKKSAWFPWLQSNSGLNAVIVIVGIAALLAALHATRDSLWRPAEVLVLAHPAAVNEKVPNPSYLLDPKHNQKYLPPRLDATPIVYVLKDDGPWVIALTAQERFLMRIPAGQVRARYVCHPRGVGETGHRPIYYPWARDYKSPNTSCEGVQTRLQQHQLPVS